MDWDVLFDGVSIADQVISFDINKSRGSYCKDVTVEVADYTLKDSIDLTEVPSEALIEIRTNTGSGWISEGTFFVERCTLIQTKEAITLSLWGRDESAKLTQPFAQRMSKEYDEDTTLYEIIEEILDDCGIAYDVNRMMIDDFTIYANSYSVQEMYPLEVLQQLVGVTDGFLYTDRQNQLWVLKDEYSWSNSVTEIGATVIESISEREDYPEFGNRIHVGSYADSGELDIDVNLEFDETYVACGEGVTGRAVVTRKDGTPVAAGYKVEWDTDNGDYAAWENEETSVTDHHIDEERAVASSRRLVSTEYPIRQVHAVTLVSTGADVDVKECEGTSITLDEDLPFTNSAVLIDYTTAYATNTLVGGSTGEVEVDVHAIVEQFVRDSQTIRIDTTSGDPVGDEAAFVTIVQRDFITDEVIEDPGEVRLDDVLMGETEEGMLDLGLVEGGEHDISIRDVTGYKDTDEVNEGLDNDTIRVGQTVYELAEGEETTDVISEHNDLSNIQGGQSGQYYHLTAAEYAALNGQVSLSGLSDVVITDVVAGELLMKYGDGWINATLAEANISSVGHIHDDRYYTETEVDTWRNSVTQTEMGYLHGVTSDVQTQLNAAVLIDGSRALTANWDVGSYKITARQLESDVVTGTAPLIVVSTTLVSNLNADKLDSQHGSYYLDSDNFTGTGWIDLTDSGETSLHIHDSRYYTETEVDALFTAHVGAADPHTVYPLDTEVLKKDGSVALTSDWDIGDGRKIQADKIAARDGDGLYLVDDGDNGIFVKDGGYVGIGETDPDEPLHITESVNAISIAVKTENANAGAAAQTQIALYNDNSHASLFYCSSGWGAPWADAVGFWNYKSTGSFAFAPGNSLKMFISYNGNITIGGGYGATTLFELEKTETLTGNTSDDWAAALTLDPGYTGAYTVTRHNYIAVQNVSTAGGAAVTDAALLYFNAAIGTHKVLAAAFQTTDDNGDVTDWAGGIKINVNGTLYKIPLIAV